MKCLCGQKSEWKYNLNGQYYYCICDCHTKSQYSISEKSFIGYDLIKDG